MKEFELFIREKRYVQNVSEHTIEFYTRGFNMFKKHGFDLETISKVQLMECITSMREQGMSAACADAHIRAINPLLRWLFENELTSTHFKVTRIKFEKRVMKTFTEKQIVAVINYKPKDWYEKRIHTLLLTLADTGIRINEALTLERSNLDLDNLLIKVTGKGNKQRIVPFSIELRKYLFKYSGSHKHSLIFCNRNGGKLLYDNCRRDFSKLIEKLGIDGFDGAFHAFRRFFATNYIRQSGNTFMLQRLLGHTSQKMTSEYVKLVTEDLSREQSRTSILNKSR